MPRSWLLPEDGEIDEIAVEVAAAGLRPVMLTPLERRAAAALILGNGRSIRTMAYRLHMDIHRAVDLARELRGPTIRAAS